jgi:hypothetical protein
MGKSEVMSKIRYGSTLKGIVYLPHAQSKTGGDDKYINQKKQSIKCDKMQFMVQTATCFGTGVTHPETLPKQRTPVQHANPTTTKRT